MIRTDHKKIASSLHAKGWKKSVVRSTLHILNQAEKKKHPHIKKLDEYFFWSVLALLILGTSMLLFGMLYVIVSMPTWLSVVSIIVAGLCFGFLLDNLLVLFRKFV